MVSENTIEGNKQIIIFFSFTYFLHSSLTAVLLRNGPSNIIFFGCRDPLRSVLPESLENFGLLADFLSGACLGAFISTIFYPLNTTKTHMQVMVKSMSQR